MGYDKMVDYWTIGILLYELVFGHTPFYAKDRKLIFQNILKNPINFNKEISKEL